VIINMAVVNNNHVSTVHWSRIYYIWNADVDIVILRKIARNYLCFHRLKKRGNL
jgi:hypothetical protein